MLHSVVLFYHVSKSAAFFWISFRLLKKTNETLEEQTKIINLETTYCLLNYIILKLFESIFSFIFFNKKFIVFNKVINYLSFTQ